jgi:hypothetical protein
MFGNAPFAMATLAGTIALGSLSAEAVKPTAEKRLLIQTLKDLAGALEGFRADYYLAESASTSIRQVQWLQAAAENWQPKRQDEGKGLRESLQLMLGAISRAAGDAASLAALIPALAEDLQIKKDHCLLLGLDARQKVDVRTLRGGVQEVKGLEVWYVEKFLASDPRATAHRFRGFSSPVSQEIVPGRYMFWAKDPLQDRSGARVEQRVGVGSAGAPGSQQRAAAIEIEVLTP